MVNLIVRVGVNAAALWAAAAVMSGIELSSDFWSVIWVAAIFGVVNAVLKPAAKLISLPFILLTLGLFTLVVNAAMLGVTARITDSLAVDGFWAAVGGAVIISVVSWALSIFLPDEERSD